MTSLIYLHENELWYSQVTMFTGEKPVLVGFSYSWETDATVIEKK